MTFFAGIKPIEEDEDIKAIRAGATPPRPPTNNELASLVEQIVAQSQQPVDSSPPGKLGFGKRLALAALGTASPSAQSQVVNPLIAARTPDAQQGRERAAQQQEFQNMVVGAEIGQRAKQAETNDRLADIQAGNLELGRRELVQKAREIDIAIEQIEDAREVARLSGGGLLDVMMSEDGKMLGSAIDATVEEIVSNPEKYGVDLSTAGEAYKISKMRLGILFKEEMKMREAAATGNVAAADRIEKLRDQQDKIATEMRQAAQAIESAADPDAADRGVAPPLIGDVNDITRNLRLAFRAQESLDEAIAGGFFQDDLFRRTWQSMTAAISSSLLSKKEIKALADFEGITAEQRKRLIGTAQSLQEARKTGIAIPEGIGGDPRVMSAFLENSISTGMSELDDIAFLADPDSAQRIMELKNIISSGQGAKATGNTYQDLNKHFGE